MDWKSKQQLDEEQKFSLLPQDDYELMIWGCRFGDNQLEGELKIEKRDKYLAKPDKEGKMPQEENINVILKIIACKDGSEALDEEGKPAKDRIVFFQVRPESMSFTTAGVPSKSRALVAAATGQDVNGSLELADWNDLIGKIVYAEIIQYSNQKGQLRNKISRIVSPPKGKGKAKVAKKELTDDDIEELKEVDIPIVGEPAEGVNTKDIPF